MTQIPTLWTVNHIQPSAKQDEAVNIHDENGKCIAYCFSPDINPKAVAHAERIVECVNAHAGLKTLVGELCDGLQNSNIEMRVSIAKAELSTVDLDMLRLRIQANEAILTKARVL